MQYFVHFSTVFCFLTAWHYWRSMLSNFLSLQTQGIISSWPAAFFVFDFFQYIYIYIYIYICIITECNLSLHEITSVFQSAVIFMSCMIMEFKICIFRQHFFVNANFIKHNRHFMSTYFLLDPFEFPYYFYHIRGELIYVFSIVVCIPTTFCPNLGHHQGRIYYTVVIC